MVGEGSLQAWTGTHLALDAIGGAVAVCSRKGDMVGASPAARDLLLRLGIRSVPARLSEELWRQLASAAVGEAVELSAEACPEISIGCTRYPLGDKHMLLLMRDVSDKKATLHQRLHRQRLEITGRLVATIAHDLRAPLASIVFNAAVLDRGVSETPPEVLKEILSEIQAASQRLKTTVNDLLDFARIGPPLPIDVSLREVLDRVSAILRGNLRAGDHRLTVSVSPAAEWVRAPALVVEQVLLNLVMNAIEASTEPVSITVCASEVRRDPGEQRYARIAVSDDGPGIIDSIRTKVFEPFFTTKPDGIGLGLTSARDAALELGGDLLLEPRGDRGATFVLTLLAGEKSSTAGGQ